MFRVVVSFGEPTFSQVKVTDESASKVQADGRWQSRKTPLKIISDDIEECRQFAIDYHANRIKTITEQIRFHVDCIGIAKKW